MEKQKRTRKAKGLTALPVGMFQRLRLKELQGVVCSVCGRRFFVEHVTELSKCPFKHAHADVFDGNNQAHTKRFAAENLPESGVIDGLLDASN